jgi:hypothetical protein
MIRGVIFFMSAVVCLLIVAFAVVRSLGNAERPQASLACATKLYSTYDPANLEQCVAVCLACSAGVKTTCSTSCKLRGAR